MSTVTATRADDGGVTLTVHDSGEVIVVALAPRKALLLGADLVRLAAEGELRVERVRQVPWGPARWGEGTKLG